MTDRILPRSETGSFFDRIDSSWIGPGLAVVSVIGLRRTVKLAALGAAAIWLLEQTRDWSQGGNAAGGISRRKRHADHDAKVDIASEESFPASDPPSYTQTGANGAH